MVQVGPFFCSCYLVQVCFLRVCLWLRSIEVVVSAPSCKTSSLNISKVNAYRPDPSWACSSCTTWTIITSNLDHSIGPRTLHTKKSLGIHFRNQKRAVTKLYLCFVGNVIIFFCNFNSLLIGFEQSLALATPPSQLAKYYNNLSEEKQDYKKKCPANWFW